MSEDLSEQTLDGVPPEFLDWAAERRLAEKRAAGMAGGIRKPVASAKALRALAATAPAHRPRRRVNWGPIGCVLLVALAWSAALILAFT